MNDRTPGELADSSAVNLVEIWEIFWNRKLLIIICALIALIFSFVKVTFFTADIYSTSGLLYVKNHTETAETEKSARDTAVYGSDLSTSQQMTSTYTEILTTNSFLEEVSQATGKRYSAGQIRGMLSITPKEDTALLQVNVTSTSATDAYAVATAVMEKAPGRLGDIFEGGEVKVIEDAPRPNAPISKNLPRTLGISAIVGMAVGCALAFLLNCFDTKVHRSDEIAKRYNVSILGEIPQ